MFYDYIVVSKFENFHGKKQIRQNFGQFNAIKMIFMKKTQMWLNYCLILVLLKNAFRQSTQHLIFLIPIVNDWKNAIKLQWKNAKLKQTDLQTLSGHISSSDVSNRAPWQTAEDSLDQIFASLDKLEFEIGSIRKCVNDLVSTRFAGARQTTWQSWKTTLAHSIL